MLLRVGSNVYVIEIPPHYGISSTFDIEDLVAYTGQPLFPDFPFDDTVPDSATNSIPDSVPSPISLAHKEHIDAILHELVVFTRDGEVQHFLVR